jgi:acrylyl-CoA reductase (NADPH)
MGTRQETWRRMATDLKPEDLSIFVQQEAALEELPDILPAILKGKMRGRVIVRL